MADKKISDLSVSELTEIVKNAMKNNKEGSSLKSKIRELREKKELDELQEQEQRRNMPKL